MSLVERVAEWPKQWLREGREQGREPFGFAPRLWLIGPGVDECDAELGADQRQVLGAVVGAVVDVQPLREAAADQRVRSVPGIVYCCLALARS